MTRVNKSLIDALEEVKATKTPKKKIVKSTYNKFFPTANSFVTMESYFKEADDWCSEVTFQTGLNRYISFWISDYQPENELKQLKAFVEAGQKAIEFIEKSMKTKKPLTVDDKRVTKQRK